MTDKEKLEILINALHNVYDICQTPWSNPWMAGKIRTAISDGLNEIGEVLNDE